MRYTIYVCLGNAQDRSCYHRYQLYSLNLRGSGGRERETERERERMVGVVVGNQRS